MLSYNITLELVIQNKRHSKNYSSEEKLFSLKEKKGFGQLKDFQSVRTWITGEAATWASWSLLLNKVAGLRCATLLRKRL